MKREEFVYFMRPIGGEGPVKIGYSWNPTARLALYSHWSPFPLEIALSIPGAAALEGKLHCHFAHLRTHHEWFRAAPELLQAMDELRAGTFDFSTLPAGKNQFRQASARKAYANRRRAA